jgi:hypothetical protein
VTLENFMKRLPAARMMQAVTDLVRLRQLKALKSSSVGKVVESLDEEMLAALLRDRGNEILENYPGDEPAMGKQLARLLRSLPHHPGHFKERLQWALAGQHLLEDQDQRLVLGWANCKKAINEIGRLQEDKRLDGPTRMNRLTTAAREMAIAADEAMGRTNFEAEPALGKRECLRKVGKELLGKPLLPPGSPDHDLLWQKISQQFENHQWPAEGSGKKEAPKPAGGPITKKELTKKELAEKEAAQKEAIKKAVGTSTVPLGKTSRWLNIAVIAAIVLIMVAVIWFLVSAFNAPPKPRKKKGGGMPNVIKPAEPASPRTGKTIGK